MVLSFTDCCVLCVAPVFEVPCSDNETVSNCSAFSDCADAAYPCTDSYFVEFLQPFCHLEKKTSETAKSWVSSVASCLVFSILDFFNTSYTPCPAPSECNALRTFMFHAQQTCLNLSLCETSFTSDDAEMIAGVVSMGGQLRDRQLEQLLQLVESCGSNNSLLAAIQDEGFVHCLIVALSGETNIEASARLLGGLEAAIETEASVGSYLNSTDSALCPVIPPALDGNGVVLLAYLNTGTGALSRYRLCEVTRNVSDAVVYCPLCGDGVVQLPLEHCDDGNVMSSDGCDMNCAIEEGHDCNVNAIPSKCYDRVCGDGIRVAGEKCDAGVDGPGCSELSCLVIREFTCEAPFFNRSVCFSCGNGIVEEPEECDNGLSAFVDGCNNMCHIERFFGCKGDLGEASVCEHVAIDFNVPDETTLDPPVIEFSQPNVKLFLVETPETLDASKLGNEVRCRYSRSVHIVGRSWTVVCIRNGLIFVSSFTSP